MNNIGDFTWWKHGVICQIYPRSIYDANKDGIGDLPGVIEKLDCLAWLGVDAIWLSTVNTSPMSDFGYDISDYRGIDPVFGTLDDCDRLIEEAHRRDIRIIMDLVINHTSHLHPWFAESRLSRENPKRDWYIWHDGKNGKPPNNWMATFGGRAWERDEATNQYYYHSFLKEQPDINWRNPGLRKAVLDEYADRMSVGETYVASPESVKTAASYLGNGSDELHLAFDFPLLFSKYGARRFRDCLAQWCSEMPERMPMQWSDGDNAGFTAVRPWLPVTDNYREVNVAVQENDPASLFSFYRSLIRMRKERRALHRGSFALAGSDPDVLAFIREIGRERLLVALNFSGSGKSLVTGEPSRRNVVFGSDRAEGSEFHDPIELAAYEVLVLEQNS